MDEQVIFIILNFWTSPSAYVSFNHLSLIFFFQCDKVSRKGGPSGLLRGHFSSLKNEALQIVMKNIMIIYTFACHLLSYFFCVFFMYFS